MSLWNDFVTAALLGTERGTQPSLPGSLGELDGALAASGREERFLSAAGAFALWRSAGTQLATTDERPEPASPETLPLISAVSVGHLRSMLGTFATAVLPEWFGEVVRLGLRVPPELLPALLKRGERDWGIRSLTFKAGGERVRWLAAQNERWRFESDAKDDPELWETGAQEERLASIAKLRAAAPEEAMKKIEETWKNERVEMRVELLNVLRDNLSLVDEPLLERALDDRSRDVRNTARHLLERLPGSALVERMKSRVDPLLTFKSGMLRSSIEVVLPGEPDKEAARDGLYLEPEKKYIEMGPKALLLLRMLSVIPPSYWSEKFNETPEVILKAAKKNEFSLALATGWASSAVSHNDAVWAEALLDSGIELEGRFSDDHALFRILPEAQRIERLIELLRGGVLVRSGTKEPDMYDVVNYLYSFAPAMPLELGREFLAAIGRFSGEEERNNVAYIEATLLEKLPRELLSEAIELIGRWPLSENSCAPKVIQALSFRRDALNALHP